MNNLFRFAKTVALDFELKNLFHLYIDYFDAGGRDFTLNKTAFGEFRYLWE